MAAHRAAKRAKHRWSEAKPDDDPLIVNDPWAIAKPPAAPPRVAPRTDAWASFVPTICSQQPAVVVAHACGTCFSWIALVEAQNQTIAQLTALISSLSSRSGEAAPELPTQPFHLPVKTPLIMDAKDEVVETPAPELATQPLELPDERAVGNALQADGQLEPIVADVELDNPLVAAASPAMPAATHQDIKELKDLILQSTASQISKSDVTLAPAELPHDELEVAPHEGKLSELAERGLLKLGCSLRCRSRASIRLSACGGGSLPDVSPIVAVKDYYRNCPRHRGQLCSCYAWDLVLVDASDDPMLNDYGTPVFGHDRDHQENVYEVTGV